MFERSKLQDLFIRDSRHKIFRLLTPQPASGDCQVYTALWGKVWVKRAKKKFFKKGLQLAQEYLFIPWSFTLNLLMLMASLSRRNSGLLL